MFSPPLVSARPGDSFGASRGDLLADGWTPRSLTDAVRGGTLLRPRNGHYLSADAPDDVVLAITAGGRLTCLSALEQWGAFVLNRPAMPHIHLDPHATRVRLPPAGVRRRGDRLLRRPHPQAG
jgi:hypothetical protein